MPVESNLNRSPLHRPLDRVAGPADPAPISARGLLGPTAGGPALSPGDLRVLAALARHLRTKQENEQGARTVQLTLYRLAQDIYGDSGGENLRLVRGSLLRLYDFKAVLPGYCAVTHRMLPNLGGGTLTRLLFELGFSEQLQLFTDPRRRGGLRGELTLTARFSDWLAEQVAADHVAWLDVDLWRALGNGLPARLWAYLEAESTITDGSDARGWKRVHDGVQGWWADLQQPMLATLGLHEYRRERRAREALSHAGERICEIDPAYVRVWIAQGPCAWQLHAERAETYDLARRREAWRWRAERSPARRRAQRRASRTIRAEIQASLLDRPE